MQHFSFAIVYFKWEELGEYIISENDRILNI